MQPLDRDLLHLVGNRVLTVAGKAVDAGSHDEVRAELLRLAEQLVDVAFSIADVHAAIGRREQRRRLLQVLQPANAFLLLDRHAHGIDLGRQSSLALELLAVPELDRGDAQRQAVGRHGEARMHEDAADGMHCLAPVLGVASPNALREADVFRTLAFEAELRRILQHEDRAVRGGEALRGCLKMAAQDVGFIDTFVREKSIRGLGVRPVLARERQTSADRAADVGKQRLESPSEPFILEGAVDGLLIDPLSCFTLTCFIAGSARSRRPFMVFRSHRAPAIANQVLDKESQPIPATQELLRRCDSATHAQLWVIESLTGGLRRTPVKVARRSPARETENEVKNANALLITPSSPLPV